VSFVKSPVAFVASTVLPDLDASTMTVLALPLAEVLCSVFELKLGAFLYFRSVVTLSCNKFFCSCSLQCCSV
jgi:hypothetical protein